MIFDSGVAHNGLEQIDVNGYDLLIIGAGPIGLLAASVAKALGKEGKKERKKECYSENKTDTEVIATNIQNPAT